MLEIFVLKYVTMYKNELWLVYKFYLQTIHLQIIYFPYMYKYGIE